MATLSNAQLQALWVRAGGKARDAPMAAAIALGESSGNPGASGDGGQSHGLWQVYTPAHPQYSSSKLRDPLYNARAAVQISGNGRTWQPWTIYNTGAYKQFLTGNKTADISGLVGAVAKPKQLGLTGLMAAPGSTAGVAAPASTGVGLLLSNMDAAKTAGTTVGPVAGASPLPDPAFSRAMVVPGGAQLPSLGPPTPPEPVQQPTTTAGTATPAGGVAAQLAKPKVSPVLGTSFTGRAKFDRATVSPRWATVLTKARALGWKGTISDPVYGGLRTTAQQRQLNRNGEFSAPAGTSLHESGRAVDVTQAAQLARLLPRIPEAKGAVWAGSKDPPHVSFPIGGRW